MNLSPFQKVRRKELQAKSLQQLQNVCRRLNAIDLAEGNAHKAVIIRRLLFREEQELGRIDDLEQEIFNNGDYDNEGEFLNDDMDDDDDDEDSAATVDMTQDNHFIEPNDEDPSPEATRLMELRHDIHNHYLRKGVDKAVIRYLFKGIKFPSDPDARVQFIKAETNKIREISKRAKSWLDKHAKNHLCGSCFVSFTSDAAATCEACKRNGDRLPVISVNSSLTPAGINPDRRGAPADPRIRPQPAGNDLPVTPYSDFSEWAARLLPNGITLETMEPQTYQFMTQFDPQVIRATVERKFEWLHHYRAATMAERSTKSPSFAGTGSSALTIDAVTGQISTSASLRLVTKRITNTDQLLTSLSNLHRLEQKFRSSDSMLRDMQTVTKWSNEYGWEAALTCVEDLRQLRMAMRTYDSLGLANPDPQCFTTMIAQSLKSRRGDGTANPKAERQNARDDKAKRSRGTASASSTSGAGKANAARPPAAIMDAARAEQLCLKYQMGTCKEKGDHTITPARGANGPFTVRHACAHCKEAGNHGWSACPKRP